MEFEAHNVGCPKSPLSRTRVLKVVKLIWCIVRQSTAFGELEVTAYGQ